MPDELAESRCLLVAAVQIERLEWYSVTAEEGLNLLDIGIAVRSDDLDGSCATHDVLLPASGEHHDDVIGKLRDTGHEVKHGIAGDLDGDSAARRAHREKVVASTQEGEFAAELAGPQNGVAHPFVGRDPGNYNKGYLGGWGIDQRDPTADRRLVEFCLGVPLEQFLRNGVWRSLARRAFTDRVPAVVLDEPKTGLQAVDWHEGLAGSAAAYQDEVQRLRDVPAAASTLNLSEMQNLLENLPAGNWNSMPVVMKYRSGLMRGISAGHFLRKAAGSNY